MNPGITYTIDAVEQVILLRCSGPVSVKQLIEVMKRIGTDAQFDPCLRVLADLRDATGDWDYSEVQSFRDYVVRIGRGCRGVRWAALTTPGTLAAACHVVVVITDALDCGITIRLFEQPSAAQDWLRADGRNTQPAARAHRPTPAGCDCSDSNV